MYRILNVDNLSWNITSLELIFNCFESWKDLSPARAVSDHQSKKEGSAWLDKLRTTNLRHQIQTRFCHFCCFPASLGKTWAVASWQSYFCFLFKLINIFSDLLSMGAVQTCASTQ